MPHLAVFDADAPVFGHPAAPAPAGQVDVLVADLAGDGHRRGGRGDPVLAGGERLHLVQQTQHPGQGRIPGARVIPVRIQRRRVAAARGVSVLTLDLAEGAARICRTRQAVSGRRCKLRAPR